MNIQFIFLLVAFALLLYISLSAIDLRNGIKAIIFNQSLPVYFEVFPKKMPAHYKQILNRNEKYYRELSPKLQRSFESRLMKFMTGINFETREGLQMTSEMKILIGSAAIKITFGLRDYKLGLFHTIIIYPNEFYSEVSHLHLKGEANASGVIAFSWEDLKFGVSIPDDSINLGYHEFAHALFLEHLMNPYNNSFKDHYREWLVFIKNNAKLREVKKKHIFRDYAAVNEMEFFAVALENFFENPAHFKMELPRLYVLMTEMLNQDPAMV